MKVILKKIYIYQKGSYCHNSWCWFELQSGTFVGHRSFDLPAEHYTYNGIYVWMANGDIHRVDRPAITYLDGVEAYYSYGKLIRINDPHNEN